MSKIVVTIVLNEGYPDNPQQEFARTLRSIANDVAAYAQGYQRCLVDDDGNPIGTVCLDTTR